MRTVLITGGLGFIGTNLVRYWLQKYNDRIVVVDSETYAARPDAIEDLGDQFVLEPFDIRERSAMEYVFKKWCPEVVIHLAAESHVCRSIEGPEKFFRTNIDGTINLLEACRAYTPYARFLHVSTDEVFGELRNREAPAFNESTALQPRSPYAASKAASDLIALAYHQTYGLNVVVSNCSNNYGPNQHREKLIPAAIHAIALGKPVRVFQDGQQIREWLHVLDHCRALDTIIHKGARGERYVVGSRVELRNLEVVELIHDTMDQIMGGAPELKMEFVNARPTDDFRYAVDSSKLRALGWAPQTLFLDGLRETVRSYIGKLHPGAGAASDSPVVRGEDGGPDV